VPNKALTDLGIQKLKPRAVRYEVPDPGARGLRVIVQPSGRKSYAVRFRNAAGRARKLTLPTGITLAAARKLAGDALLEVAQGRDPVHTKRAGRASAKEAAARAERDTVAALAEQFTEQHVRRHLRPASIRATEAAFHNIILPAWGGRSVHDITRRDVLDILDSVVVDRPILANRLKAVLSKFFNWCASRDVIKASPVVGVASPSREIARDRVLPDDELRRLWGAAETVGGNAGSHACEVLERNRLIAAACAYVKLLILTGQRRGEIGSLRWTEVGDDALSIGAERMKGKQAHVVPLSTQAAAVIQSMPKQDEFVLGAALRWHYHHVKDALDAQLGDVPEWVVHDVRRSVASGMARIGISVPVIEKILAHRSGTFRGIVGTYQRHSFLPEMAIAAQKWADHVERLVSGKVARVVKLQRR
jgi:integrase